MEKYLLSITIPTYNRATFLDMALSKIHEDLKNVKDKVEVLISDNCSTDNTSEIVQRHTNNGLAIRYIRNETNLGMDRNFAQCFRLAKGKFIWLLSDDDHLKEGTLEKILNVIRDKDYGLIHIKQYPINHYPSDKKEFGTEFVNNYDFFVNIDHWLTFISGNIVNAQYVNSVNFENYFDTYLSQIPLYLEAATNSEKNLIIDGDLLERGLDYDNNGGYNYIKIFVENNLSIWYEFYKKGKVSKKIYNFERMILFKNKLLIMIYPILLSKELSNYETDNSWKILFKYYKYSPYFYKGIVKLLISKRYKLWLACKKILGVKV